MGLPSKAQQCCLSVLGLLSHKSHLHYFQAQEKKTAQFVVDTTANVVFAPDLFDEPWRKDKRKDNNLWIKDSIGKGGSPSGEESTRQTYHTTCMGINTHR